MIESVGRAFCVKCDNCGAKTPPKGAPDKAACAAAELGYENRRGLLGDPLLCFCSTCAKTQPDSRKKPVLRL